MQAWGRLGGYIRRGVCNVSGPFLPFGGAVDIIVVQQKDGSFKSSPWYVRFGKFHRVMKAAKREKVKVSVSVNGVETDFHMCLSPKGEAFFLHGNLQHGEGEEEEQEGQDEEEDGIGSMWCYDDIQVSGSNKRQFKSKSCNFRSEVPVVDRTSSRRSRMCRLVFGPSSDGGDGEDADADLVERAEIAAKLLDLRWSTNITFDELPYRERKKTQGDKLDKERGKTEESGEVLRLASEVCGEVHVHDKVLHTTTLQLPEGGKADGVTRSVHLERPVTDCGICDVADVGSRAKFQKSQTVNIGRRDRSVKKVSVNTPTSEQLSSLNLKEGRNTITFCFSTPMMGMRQIDARIFLWKWNTRIVISDVDGTITRSDVLGQFMPLVGIDWSQTGVAHLFSDIKENGYQLLFLSARAISQAHNTRQFLFNLNQDGKVLPDGPVVISPDGLFPSLYREVILRAPHEFKIACLEDIRALFPPDCNPFYAGFGNRDTDEISYLKVGIPKGKIFIINPKGEVSINRRYLDTNSYTSLHTLVNGMFPPTNSSEQEDYNSWNFWKLPPI
ncbi:phosphatidate phosphatase PAH2 [Lathyrus oleraceus]|uniref:LNS2/PITP domain-containing protein n=1 Tax=Pisum sativum TaxID=3888 RepID=A0A9D4W140_PEA|nr:phosphatidate phosphatase PAH2-like [Pisum sativum]XP_050886465.1 phosphatidate phosphatase PAH2-like [Pisum sativum]XP_050886466.1 phosphatidate phosphatase PAH2-like [Pisum sativum]KAI5393137.1 hypothetical protein KIW84_060322 [Pisum sativum]